VSVCATSSQDSFALLDGVTNGNSAFSFDRFFDENASQSDFYEGTTRQLIDSVLDGFYSTVFAYGTSVPQPRRAINGRRNYDTDHAPMAILQPQQAGIENEAERDASQRIADHALEVRASRQSPPYPQTPARGSANLAVLPTTPAAKPETLNKPLRGILKNARQAPPPPSSPNAVGTTQG
jgi:hypothetical protein